MGKNSKITIFEGKKIRRIWDNKQKKWWFSVVDVVVVLSDSTNPQVYWRVLKKRLLDEGADETVTKRNTLKILAADGKMRLTDVADTETMLRIIQSIPSPNAEPFKLWLARVGYVVRVIPTKVGIQSVVYMDPRVKPEDDNGVCLKRIMFIS